MSEKLISLPILRVVGQLANNYILAEAPEGLYLIDQHAAHERILFEKILSRHSQPEMEVQGLLEPVTVELSPKEEEILEASNELLSQFGFTLEPFGSRSYLLRAVPALVKDKNPAEIVKMLLDSMANGEALSWEEKIAQSLACHSAVKAGDLLTDDEMKELVKQLERTEQPRTCPHGRPTVVLLSSYQLKKEFAKS